MGNLIPTQSLSTYMDGTVVTACDVYAGASESSTYLGRMEPGTQVTVYSISGGWAFFRMAEYFGYCRVSNLTPGHVSTDPTPTPTPAPTTAPGGNSIPGTVISVTCPIYASNSTNSTKIGSLPSNTQLNVLAVSGGWAYIEWNGNYGFCQVGNLIPTQSLSTYMDGTVVTACDVYARASESSTYLGRMEPGTQVTVYSISDGWAFFRMAEYFGYCRVSNLMPGHVSTDPTPTPTPAPTAAPAENSIPGTVISVTCPIYASNSTNSTKIGSLPSNTQLNVLAVSGGWAYIEWNGNYGFCQVGNLIPTQSLSTYMDGTVVTACDVYARGEREQHISGDGWSRARR